MAEPRLAEGWPFAMVQRFARFGLAGMAIFTALSLLYVAFIEFGPLRQFELNTDELYFFSCTARDSVLGISPNPGCHDNKAPFVYQLNQWLQPHPYLYDAVAMKRAAFALVLLLVGGVGTLAYRLGNLVSAVVAACLMLLALSLNAELFALKTETVGMAFVVATLLLLVSAQEKLTAVRVFFAGLLIGMALLTKQTYLIVIFPVAVWLLLTGTGSFVVRFKARLVALVGLVLGVALPFLVFLAMVSLQGAQEKFLASFFLYPAVYGEGPPSGLRPLVTQISTFLETTYQSRELLCIAFLFGAFQTLRAWWRAPLEITSVTAGRLLVLLATLAVFVPIVAAPKLFFYHVLPAWIIMPVLASVAIGDLWRQWSVARANQLLGLAAALCVMSALVANSVWLHNANRKTLSELRPVQPRLASNSGQFAYLLGMPWPSFYTDNGFIPASDVMFPWALPGMPRNFYYTPPPPDSSRGRKLAEIQARNLVQLMADFKRTPPRYIAVVDSMAHAPGSKRISDVPGFDEYLQAHCTYMKTLPGEKGVSAPLSVFSCTESRSGT